MRIDQKDINEIAALLEEYLEATDALPVDRAGLVRGLASRGPLGQAIRAQIKMTDQEAQDAVDEAMA